MKEYFSSIIADADEAFLKKIAVQNATLKPPLPLKLVRSGEELQKLLRDPNIHFFDLFVNVGIPKPGIFRLISETKALRPLTQVYCTYDHLKPFSTLELRRLDLKEPLQKWNVLEVAKTQPYKAQLDFLQAIPRTGSLLSQYVPTASDPDKEYMTIPSEAFFSQRPSPFDVYVLIPPGKFLKVLRANDVFELERLQGYVKKGSDQFYVKKSVLRRMVQYSELVRVQAPYRKQGLSADLKLYQSFCQAEKVYETLKSEVVETSVASVGSVENVAEFVLQIQESLKELAREDRVVLRSIFNQLVHYEHAVGVTFLVGVFCSVLKMETKKMQIDAGLAAFLHDIGLVRLPRNVQDLEGLSMVDLQNHPLSEQYMSHAKLGAELVAKFEGVDEVVSQSIAYHHVRRDVTSFPAGLSFPKAPRIAELIGLADEWLTLKKVYKGHESQVWLSALSQRVGASFSPWVAEIVEILKSSGAV